MATGDGERKISRNRRTSSSPRSTSRPRDTVDGRRKRRMGEEDAESRDRKKHRGKDAKRKHRSGDDKKNDKDVEKKKKKKHGHRSLVPIEVQLSAGDYFLKNNEFSTWLKEKKGIFFSDLSSVESRELFLDFMIFIKVWNKGKLHPEYYSGITKVQRSGHRWGIN